MMITAKSPDDPEEALGLGWTFIIVLQSFSIKDTDQSLG